MSTRVNDMITFPLPERWLDTPSRKYLLDRVQVAAVEQLTNNGHDLEAMPIYNVVIDVVANAADLGAVILQHQCLDCLTIIDNLRSDYLWNTQPHVVAIVQFSYDLQKEPASQAA